MCFFPPIPFGEWCKNCSEQNTPNPVPIQKNADVQHYASNQPQVKLQQRAAAQPGHIQQHGSAQPEANTQKKAIVPEQENLATQTPMHIVDRTNSSLEPKGKLVPVGPQRRIDDPSEGSVSCPRCTKQGIFDEKTT